MEEATATIALISSLDTCTSASRVVFLLIQQANQFWEKMPKLFLDSV